MAKHATPVILPEASYVLIANRYDPWPRSKQLDRFLETRGWSFISLPGSHDDIWQHPERYAPIIDHYARLLAETSA
jgi:predicted RNA binding protein YcfA (HicA-like mRNA interferase family)